MLQHQISFDLRAFYTLFLQIVTVLLTIYSKFYHSANATTDQFFFGSILRSEKIEHGVANGLPLLRHVVERSYVAQAQ